MTFRTEATFYSVHAKVVESQMYQYRLQSIRDATQVFFNGKSDLWEAVSGICPYYLMCMVRSRRKFCSNSSFRILSNKITVHKQIPFYYTLFWDKCRNATSNGCPHWVYVSVFLPLVSLSRELSADNISADTKQKNLSTGEYVGGAKQLLVLRHEDSCDSKRLLCCLVPFSLGCTSKHVR